MDKIDALVWRFCFIVSLRDRRFFFSFELSSARRAAASRCLGVGARTLGAIVFVFHRNGFALLSSHSSSEFEKNPLCL